MDNEAGSRAIVVLLNGTMVTVCVIMLENQIQKSTNINNEEGMKVEKKFHNELIEISERKP